MKNELIQLGMAFVALFLGAGLEEMSPKFFGVGFPILLSILQYMAYHRDSHVVVVFALAAGAVEDAISGLPPFASIGFFLMLAMVIRRIQIPMIWLLAYPAYQLWLLVWMIGIGGSIFNRVLVSIPLGALSVLFITLIFGWLDRRSAIDEQG